MKGGAPGDPDWSKAPTGWWRQYVGITSHGRKVVYGNFLPRGPFDDEIAKVWKTDAQVICDGGPAIFGVEYDVATKRITHIAHNGAI